MEAVNLLPAEYQARKRGRGGAPSEDVGARRALQIGGLVTLLFAVLVAGLYLHERSVVHSKQKELAETQARIAAVQPQVEALKAQQAAVQARLTAAETITGSRMNWVRALGDFARVLPTNSYLTSLQATAPVSTATAATATTPSTSETPTAPSSPATGSSTLTIAGTAPNTPGVALVMDRLALLPWLSNVTLSSASRQADGSNTFNMTAGVSETH